MALEEQKDEKSSMKSSCICIQSIACKTSYTQCAHNVYSVDLNDNNIIPNNANILHSQFTQLMQYSMKYICITISILCWNGHLAVKGFRINIVAMLWIWIWLDEYLVCVRVCTERAHVHHQFTFCIHYYAIRHLI